MFNPDEDSCPHFFFFMILFSWQPLVTPLEHLRTHKEENVSDSRKNPNSYRQNLSPFREEIWILAINRQKAFKCGDGVINTVVEVVVGTGRVGGLGFPLISTLLVSFITQNFSECKKKTNTFRKKNKHTHTTNLIREFGVMQRNL